MRKDCDNSNSTSAFRGAGIVALLGTAFAAHAALAEPRDARTIRLWSSAVVTHDPIQLSDLCELSGFTASDERTLSQLAVAEAPVSAGSRIVHIDLLRSVLGAAGVNMATTVLAGATQCEVSRPSNALLSAPTASLEDPSDRRKISEQNRREIRDASVRDGNTRHEPGAAVQHAAASTNGIGNNSTPTLRDAISRFFDVELSRFQATAEVTFDRTPSGVLDLSGPKFEFRIRRKSAAPLGLVSIESEVSSGGRVAQVVPMVVQVAMVRKVVTVRRAINQGATIATADVELSTLTFHHTDDIGINDPSELVGQRAKQMINAGAVIEPDMVEMAPLVVRGQLVTLVSESGGVRVVTAAKAAQEGKRGETIRVRADDDKHVEFDAVVIGPGEARLIGESTSGNPRTAEAARSKP